MCLGEFPALFIGVPWVTEGSPPGYPASLVPLASCPGGNLPALQTTPCLPHRSLGTRLLQPSWAKPGAGSWVRRGTGRRGPGMSRTGHTGGSHMSGRGYGDRGGVASPATPSPPLPGAVGRAAGLGSGPLYNNRPRAAPAPQPRAAFAARSVVLGESGSVLSSPLAPDRAGGSSSLPARS